MEAFKDQLVRRRESLGLSVAVAAARAGVEGPNYRAWEAGRRTPPEERQAVILAALEVSEDRAEYQRGALWALAAMHETLGRLYRELAQPAPNLVTMSAEAHRTLGADLAERATAAAADPEFEAALDVGLDALRPGAATTPRPARKRSK